MVSSLANNISLEAQAQEWANKCAAYSDQHHKENPDLLYEYGKAIFEVAKQSSNLLDTQKVDERQMPMENPKVKLAVDADEEDGEDDKSEEAESAEDNDAGADTNHEADQSGDEADAAEEGDDEQDDFAFAFHVVESARVLYTKQEQTREVKEKLAKTLETLGDISLEDDNAQQAASDYTSAAELKKELYGAESGNYSEIEFMLSLAYDTLGEPQKSLDHLKKAAAAAAAAGLSSASELQERVLDLEQELRIVDKIGNKNSETAQKVTKEAISGRSAIADALQTMVSGANDISQLTRKRTRPGSKSPVPGSDTAKRTDSNQKDPSSAKH